MLKSRIVPTTEAVVATRLDPIPGVEIGIVQTEQPTVELPRRVQVRGERAQERTQTQSPLSKFFKQVHKANPILLQFRMGAVRVLYMYGPTIPFLGKISKILHQARREHRHMT